jgi:hypothetical protein
MTTLVGRSVTISVAEPFEQGRARTEVSGRIVGQVRSSTGLLLLVASEAGTLLIAPRYAGTRLEDLLSERLTVYVARTSKEVLDGEVIADRDIENIGSGVARLREDSAPRAQR